MAKLTRVFQKLFGSTSGSTQIGIFGSLAAGSPQFAGTNPAAVQTLANFEGGWPAAVVGGNSPALEDLNALCFLYAYQLSYLFQQGIPEYDDSTTYFYGSVLQSNGSYYQVIYGSASGVVGVTPPDPTYYKSFILDGSPTYFLSADSGSNAFTTTGTPQSIPNLNGSITALNNNPIEIKLVPTLGSDKFSLIRATSVGGTVINISNQIYLYKNGVRVSNMSQRQRVLGSPTSIIDDQVNELPPSAFSWFDDNPGSGTIVYDVRINPSDAAEVNDVQLLIKQVNN